MTNTTATLRRAAALVITAVAAALCLVAGDAADVMCRMPKSLMPLLSVNDRLDIVDYYRYGSDRPRPDIFGTEWHITALSDATVTIATTDSVAQATVQLGVIPAGRDTVVAVITTVALPARDSRVALYRLSDWSEITPVPMPNYSQWLLPDAGSVDNLDTTLPFVTAVAELDSTATTIVWRNTADEYLVPDEYNSVARVLRPSITYTTARGKFKLVKDK